MMEIYKDGASRGNPGDAAWAFLFVKNGRIVRKASGFIGTTTNNVAEYRAVIHALRTAVDEGVKKCRLNSDSELVARQLRGEYAVRTAHLLPLWQEVKRLMEEFHHITIRSVPRTHPCIMTADRLCNETLDRHRATKHSW